MYKNVKELVEFLEKIEDKENTAVFLEGCDCIGGWSGEASVDTTDSVYECAPYKKYILLNRY